MRAALWRAAAGFLTMACGGDDGGSHLPPPPAAAAPARIPAPPSAPKQSSPSAPRARASLLQNAARLDPSPRWRVLDSLWIHQQARRAPRPRSHPRARRGLDVDIGDIAVIRDEGDVIVPAEHLRPQGRRPALHAATTSGGYDVRQSDAAFRSAIGNRLTLTDDDTARAGRGVLVSVFLGSERTAFVNSDGNITFREGDNASTDRSVGRLLTGPAARGARSWPTSIRAPAAPSSSTRVSDQYTVTWCAVRGFDSPQTTTAQTTLLPDGTIEMRVRRRHHAARCRRRRLARPDPRFPARRSERAGADLRRRHRGRRTVFGEPGSRCRRGRRRRSIAPIPTRSISW